MAAIILHYLWTSEKSYNGIVFCLHAISHATFVFRGSLDRDGSILLLALFLISILTTFYMKSLFVTVFLFVMSSSIVKKCSLFIEYMIYKALADQVICFVIYLFTNSCDVSSRLTDFLYICICIFEQAILIVFLYGFEDVFLVIFIISQVIVFVYELYLYRYLCLNISLALLWICLKSLRVNRPLFPLELNLRLNLDIERLEEMENVHLEN